MVNVWKWFKLFFFSLWISLLVFRKMSLLCVCVCVCKLYVNLLLHGCYIEYKSGLSLFLSLIGCWSDQSFPLCKHFSMYLFSFTSSCSSTLHLYALCLWWEIWLGCLVTDAFLGDEIWIDLYRIALFWQFRACAANAESLNLFASVNISCLYHILGHNQRQQM